MEQIDVISDDNLVIDVVTKEEVHNLGLPHRVAAVMLVNDKGQYMLPTASDHKVESGRLFHSAAGHVVSGESYLESVIRELEEECGLTIDKSKFILLGSFWFKQDYPTRKERERFEVFEVKYQEVMGAIVLNEEQNNEQWFSTKELKNITKQNDDRVAGPLKLTLEKFILK